MIPVGGTTRYLGDAIAIVAAETPEILEQAKALVEVDYEELRPVTCPAEALAEATRSQVVQVIGTKFVLYRPTHKKDKKDKIVLVTDKKRK